MKKIKIFFKAFGIILIPLTIQVLIFMFYGISLGTKFTQDALKNDTIPNQVEITKIITEKLNNNISTLLIISALVTLILLFSFSKLKNNENLITLYRLKNIKRIHIPHILALAFLGFSFSISFSSILNLTKLSPETVQNLSNAIMNNSIIIPLISIGILAPIMEEFIFRGMILNLFSKNMNIKLAILFQAIIFSLYHMNLVQMLPTFVLGLITGTIVYYSNSLTSGIIIHVVNNILAIVLSRSLPSDFNISILISVIIILVSSTLILYLLKIFPKTNSTLYETETISTDLLS